MKHLFYLLVRILYILLVIIMCFPLMITICLIIRTIWNFKPIMNWNDFIKDMKEPFLAETYVFSNQQTFWAYQTPWDYLILNKVYLENKHYKAPIPKTEITAKDVKQKVQDTLDDINL